MAKTESVVNLDGMDVPTWSYRLVVAAMLLGSVGLFIAGQEIEDETANLIISILSVLGFYASIFYFEILVKNERKKEV